MAIRGLSVCLAGLLASLVYAADEPQQNQAPPPLHSVSGILVDRAGFPVANAQIVPSNRPSGFKSVESDAQGKFTAKDIPDTAEVLLAESDRLQRVAVIPVAPSMADDARYVFDFEKGALDGRVIDSQGKAVPGVKVSLQFEGPGGLAYQQSGKTTKDGEIVTAALPAGSGWLVRASLASGESTPAYPLRDRSTVEFDLIQQAPTTDPAAKPARKLIPHSGRIVDEGGQPIAGVLVDLFMVRDGGEIITNSDGRWSRRLPADLESIEIRLSHPDFIGFHFTRESGPPIHAMRNGTAVQVMKRGQRIAGVVHDSAGNPLANALVTAGELYSFGDDLVEDCTTARTDREGKFSIGGLPLGPRGVKVTASEFAPLHVSVTITPEMKPLEVALDRGRTVTGRFADQDGQPVPSVRLTLDDWRLPGASRQTLTGKAAADADGRFSIPALPRQGSVEVNAYAKDRMSMSFQIDPDVSDVGNVTLYSPPVIEGQVIDAETREPLKTFGVAAGWLEENGKFHALRYSDPGQGTNGRFSRKIDRLHVSRDSKLKFVVKITAPSYAIAMTPPVRLGERHEPFTIELKRAVALAGRILRPDGTPADKARVIFVGPENDTGIQGTKLNEGYSYAPDVRATADADGRFEIPSPGISGRLLVLDDSGYTLLASDQVKPGAELRLTPWARIEGVYKAGGTPRPGVRVSAQEIRPRADITSRDRLAFDLNTTTDVAGRFVIEHVPAMQLRIAAWASYGPAAAKLVQVEAGKANYITLGDDGPSVAGHVDLTPVIAANPPAPGAKFDTSTSWVRAFRTEPRPEPPAGVDPADWAAQFQSVLEGNVSTDLTIPATFADLQPDGSFAFDALAPGKYKLLVDIHGIRPPETCGWGLKLATGRAEFTVEREALTLPTVKLTATEHPKPGSEAPDIAAKTATGDAFSLSTLRGKYVVLDFWAGWCGPCRASQPALKTVFEKYKTQAVFAGLNFDYTDDRAKQAIESINSPWPQVLTGPWDTNNQTLVAYGVSVIPSIWLVDPQGKVLAKDLTPEQLDAELAKAIGQ